MQTVPEVEIRGYITEHLPEGARLSTPTGIKASAEVCRARAVIEQIEAATTTGARALVVTIDSVGGDMQASLSVYRSLRRFSESGGTVIVHVVGMAASSASTIALAGDVVLLAADARFLVHSAVGDPRAVAEANAAMLAAYLERTSTPPPALSEWLAYRFDPGADRYHCAELRAEAAIAFSWADATATAEAVRDLAGVVAAGSYCSTPRRLALASRRAAAAAIVTDKLGANAVTTEKLNVTQINSAQVLTITSPTQFTASIPSTQVTGLGTLATQNTVGNSDITTIDGGKITTGTISADRISAGSITVTKLGGWLYQSGVCHGVLSIDSGYYAWSGWSAYGLGNPSTVSNPYGLGNVVRVPVSAGLTTRASVQTTRVLASSHNNRDADLRIAEVSISGGYVDFYVYQASPTVAYDTTWYVTGGPGVINPSSFIGAFHILLITGGA